ncbi:hypothetical protein [Acetobacter persici]|uniref:hypothetical protein n=1 Tax=Acetobacter persici TaxID=1076596 RepID=UPI001F1A08BD|nr:hypothetical protein [Acetobacter persici]MCG0998177.1 hypothetical protein [Acetobacter persici]
MADPAQPVCRGDVVLRKNRAWLVVSVRRKSCGLVPIIGQTLPRHRADVTVAGLCVAGSIARCRSVTSAPLRQLCHVQRVAGSVLDAIDLALERERQVVQVEKIPAGLFRSVLEYGPRMESKGRKKGGAPTA